MLEKIITTCLGRVSVAIKERNSDIPIIFLHGVFLDKSLWTAYGAELTDRTHIYVDMPGHGSSADVGHDWCLDDCTDMLIQVMDALGISKCTVIGHSWGSMTALRAAVKFPDRFSALGLFNMPFKKTKGLRRLGFILQKCMLSFPKFYGKQAAQSLYSKSILLEQPHFLTQMQDRLAKRSAKELSRLIDAVILQPEDASHLLQQLTVPALAVIGETDYVGKPPKLLTWVVAGGHISPHESVEKITNAILAITGLGGQRDAKAI